MSHDTEFFRVLIPQVYANEDECVIVEIFVKENHRREGDFEKLRKYRRKFIIEVRDFKELHHALSLHPRVILLDNFSFRDLKQAVRVARKKDPSVILEASGGITLQNAAHYAATGIDRISAGFLTQSVKAIDFSLLMQ